jgi:ABC-2 type transport system permease protein
MNWRGGLELIRRSLFGWMAGRGFFWSLALGWMMPSLVYLFVWLRVSSENGISIFSRDDFILYYLCLILVNQFTYPVSNWTVGDVIRSGNFSAWLLRPLPPIFEAIASDIAMKMVTMPFALAVVLGLALILRPTTTITWFSFSTFLLALLLAQALRFLLAYALALLALWAARADALLMLNDTLLFLLAGQVAPILLLPPALKSAAQMLPYRYMLGFPLELLLGKLSYSQIWQGFAWQIGWLSLVWFAHRLIWQRGISHYSAVGG